MRDIDGANQIDLQHSRPIARSQIPKREAEFSGTDPHAKHHVLGFIEGVRELAHLCKFGDVAKNQG